MRAPCALRAGIKEEIIKEVMFMNSEAVMAEDSPAKKTCPKIQKTKKVKKQSDALQYQLGDSVLVMPDKS